MIWLLVSFEKKVSQVNMTAESDHFAAQSFSGINH